MTSETAEALKVEAENTEVEVTFRGETYSVERDIDEWSLEVLENYESGNLVLTLKALLGEAQWARVKAHGLKVKDLKELAEVFLSSIGLSSEKSEG